MADATLKAILLGEDRSASKALKGVGDEADKTHSRFGNMAKAGALAVGALAVGAGTLAVKVGGAALSAASDLNETVNKSNVIFGKNAAVMDKWASGAAKSMGLSKQAALESASGFGDMFTQIGFSGDKAAEMSKQIVQMSADFGSFNNLPTADVADRMAAAFRGEYDSLQAIIPNINAARVEQEAMAATGKKTAKELTAQEKAAAVLAIAHKDGARAMGDFSRTSDGLANRQKTLTAMWDDGKAKLGQGLLPIAEKVAGFMVDDFAPAAEKVGKWFSEKLMPPLKDFARDIAPKVRDYMDAIKGAFSDAQPAIKLVGEIVANVLWPAFKKVAELVLPYMAFQIGILGKAIGVLGKVGIWLWNNAFAPTIRLLLNGFAMITDGWAFVLRALGKVPGFEWAKGAAREMAHAADSARDLAAGIRAIPSEKDIRIRVTATATGLSAAGLGGVGAGVTAMTAASNYKPRKPGRNARGTNNWRGGLTWVGEEGAELLDLPPGSRIHSAAASARMAGGGVVINISGALDPVAVGKQVQKALLTVKRVNGGAALGLS